MKTASSSLLALLLISSLVHVSQAQAPEALPPAAETCNGVFISYDFLNRRKEFPRVKNATAQAWAFNSTATVLNAGTDVIKAWKLFIAFQHREILVSAAGATMFDAVELPAPVGNGTTFVGGSTPDLETSINTHLDLTQIQVQIQLSRLAG